MGYGSLALAVKSQHDNYLIGNPQFTYFKAVYKRHTNFSVDFQEVRFAQNTEDCWGKKIYLKVPKNGDLIHRAYLCVDIDVKASADNLETVDISDWANKTFGDGTTKGYAPFAYNLIEFIDLYIGDQLIDRHYGEWLHIWHELFEDSQKSLALAKMIQINGSATDEVKRLSIPLRFWFNNNVGVALPLISLQYTDVKFEIKFNKKSEVEKLSNDQTGAQAINIKGVKLLIENIYLDEAERRAFTSGKHEYLITQVQTSVNNRIKNLSSLWSSNDSKFNSLRHKVPLRFRYPVKELFWTIQDKLGDGIPIYDDGTGATGSSNTLTNTGCFKYNYWNNYRIGKDQISFCNLVLNNKELMDELPGSFYRDVQQYQYHNGYGIEHIDLFQPSEGQPLINYQDYSKGSGIYSYSFALYPESNQPSGSLNFSKLENCSLKFGLQKGKKWTAKAVGANANNSNKVVTVYALNYNVLRVMSGLAGLVFTN